MSFLGRRKGKGPEKTKSKVRPEDMIEGETYYVEAPRSFYDLIYEGRFFIVVGFLVLALVFIAPVFAEPNIQWFLGAMLASFIVAYWLMKEEYGLEINSEELENGYLKITDLEKWEFEKRSVNSVTVMSDMGPVVLNGMYVTGQKGKDGQPIPNRVACQLELLMNAKLVKEMGAFQEVVLEDWLKTCRTVDTQVTSKIAVELEELKKLLGLTVLKK